MNRRADVKKHDLEVDYWTVPESLNQRALDVARQFRKEPTRSEAVLWQALRSRKLDGWKFRRQQPIGPFILDFFCPEARLIVEVDGPVHESQREADENRQLLLQSLGFRFVRVSAAQVEKDLPSVLATIRDALVEFGDRERSEASGLSTSSPSPRSGRRG